MECKFCGMPLERVTDPVWYQRDPFCGDDCVTAHRAYLALKGAARNAGRRRDHSLCGVVPCSHCA
jgi:hypothetical protein